ncbi:hypothetical protein GWI33_003763 [Rhynchophorus ferrugineus]|uniref:Uncharacterized protein n=1 Tax=Rhynchophorus ferrugineus TaxID=354439 RepID=A0A834MH29_RHYFE|nr:hypothetical protein GWI33_003763 [Rhynchophorus ferrugineus]
MAIGFPLLVFPHSTWMGLNPNFKCGSNFGNGYALYNGLDNGRKCHFSGGQKFFTKKVNMKLWREWLLIMFFISSASSICKKVILADKEIIECNPFCRNIRDYPTAYFCESTSLDDLMAEFTHAAAEYRGL